MKNFSTIKYKFSKILRTHQVFVVVFLSLMVLLFAFYRLNTLNNMPIDQKYLNQEVEKIKTVNFNEDAIAEIKALRDSNVAVPGTELPVDRQNPFSE